MKIIKKKVINRKNFTWEDRIWIMKKISLTTIFKIINVFIFL